MTSTQFGNIYPEITYKVGLRIAKEHQCEQDFIECYNECDLITTVELMTWLGY